MSYTTAENVKRYLADSFPRLSRVTDQAFKMSGTEYLPFFGGAVESEMLIVKSIQGTDLTRQEVAFSVDRVSLSTNPLVPGSVVAASDTSLGSVYTENIDYIIDSTSGDIIRKPTGSIAVGQKTIVWFLPYAVYVEATDYSVQFDNGEIRRINSGSIASDETVYLDYTPVLKAYNDAAINGAVVLANGLVQNEVDPGLDFGADPALETAATFRALAIICQTSAVRDLSQSRGTRRASADWLQLADSFDRKAGDMLSRFRPPFNSPKPPIIG